MQLTAEPKYEEQFTAFIDILGFSEVSTEAEADESIRSQILYYLKSLSALRGESNVQSVIHESGKTISIKPAISTFSDHIVISYPLKPISDEMELDEQFNLIAIIGQFAFLLTQMAVAALRIGFLVRGGATIGKLYHAQGVVFGKALIDAYLIESRTSIYPRVVLSRKITSRLEGIEARSDIRKCDDGLYHVDYFKKLVLSAAMPADSHAASVKAWIKEAVSIITKNLTELESQGKLNELAKWAWFAHEFRSGLERINNPKLMEALGISLEAIPWPK
jgi:hypothetical protein